MKTAIVFEDDRRIADYVGEILHDVGMDVTHSDCHGEALPVMPIDLAVCDLSHHNLLVTQSLNTLRHEHHETRVIAIIDRDQRVEGIRRDDAILERPFNAADLLTVINQLESQPISHVG